MKGLNQFKEIMSVDDVKQSPANEEKLKFIDDNYVMRIFIACRFNKFFFIYKLKNVAVKT